MSTINPPKHVSDRRRYHRYPTADRVVLEVTSEEPNTPVPGMTTDVSREGVGIVVDEPIVCGRWVKIDAGNCQIVGQVKNCRSVGSKYRIGVAISRISARHSFALDFEERGEESEFDAELSEAEDAAAN